MEPGPRTARKRRSHWPDPSSVPGTRTLALSAPRLAPVRGSRLKRQPGSATGGGGATSRSTGRAPSVRGGCCYSLCYLPKQAPSFLRLSTLFPVPFQIVRASFRDRFVHFVSILWVVVSLLIKN